MALTQEQLDALPKYKNTAQAVAGKDVIIYVAAQANPYEWVLIGGQQNSPIAEKADSIDATDKTTGNYSKKLAGLHSWSISFSGLWVLGDEGIEICHNRFTNDEPALFRIEYADGSYRQGWGTITAFSDDNAHKNALSVKMTIEGNGELSSMVTPPTPTVTSPTISASASKDATVKFNTADIAIRALKDESGISLEYDVDYDLVGDTLTVKKEYLSKIKQATTLTAKFANKVDIAISVTAG